MALSKAQYLTLRSLLSTWKTKTHRFYWPRIVGRQWMLMKNRLCSFEKHGWRGGKEPKFTGQCSECENRVRHQVIWEGNKDGGGEGERSLGGLAKLNPKGWVGMTSLPDRLIRHSRGFKKRREAIQKVKTAQKWEWKETARSLEDTFW